MRGKRSQATANGKAYDGWRVRRSWVRRSERTAIQRAKEGQGKSTDSTNYPAPSDQKRCGKRRSSVSGLRAEDGAPKSPAKGKSPSQRRSAARSGWGWYPGAARIGASGRMARVRTQLAEEKESNRGLRRETRLGEHNEGGDYEAAERETARQRALPTSVTELGPWWRRRHLKACLRTNL